MLQVSPGVYEYVPSPVDEEVKVGVIRDTLRLMDPAQRKQHAMWVIGFKTFETVDGAVCICVYMPASAYCRPPLSFVELK